MEGKVAVIMYADREYRRWIYSAFVSNYEPKMKSRIPYMLMGVLFATLGALGLITILR
jgi:hypothetical protein